MTADEKRDDIAQCYIGSLEFLYHKAIYPQKCGFFTKPPLLNLATQIAAELRRAKASLVTAKEQRELAKADPQMATDIDLAQEILEQE